MFFLAVVASICALLISPLKIAFVGNVPLNTVILATLGLGILFIIKQTLRLTPERKWLLSIQKTGSLDTSEKRPVLLATVYAMLADSRHDAKLSALSLRSVLDGVAARLDGVLRSRPCFLRHLRSSHGNLCISKNTCPTHCS